MYGGERKWKMEIGEWNFEKNIPAKEMNFMVEKAEKRKLNEGKPTTFLRGEIEGPKDKFDQHKRRKVVREATESIFRAYQCIQDLLLNFPLTSSQKHLQTSYTTLLEQTFRSTLGLAKAVTILDTSVKHPDLNLQI